MITSEATVRDDEQWKQFKGLVLGLAGKKSGDDNGDGDGDGASTRVNASASVAGAGGSDDPPNAQKKFTDIVGQNSRQR